MRMSVLIILLCIHRSLTVEHVKESARINKENDEPKEETNSKDRPIEQYDSLETEYEDEDLGDSPDVDMNKSPIKEGTEGEKIYIINNTTSKHAVPSLPQLQKMMRLVRAALPTGNTSKLEEAESDMEEEEEFEDAENNASTEEQEEAEIYDSGQPGNKVNVSAISERSKRQTVNMKKETVSSSPDLIEIGDDESLNENDGQDYGDFSPTRKESMTVRTRQRRSTSKSLAYRDIPSVSTVRSKGRRVNDNNRVASDNIETRQMKKGIIHAKKGKQPKGKEKLKNALKNGGDNDFEELKKAYNALVCSVENFMGMANKTMLNKADEYCQNGRNGSNTTSNGKNESSQTIDWCASSTSKLECITTCDDSDFDSGDHFRKADEDEDINSNMKKKFKGLKMEYPTADDSLDKPGAYVYNDYDSVDPSEYDTNVSGKSTSFPPSVINKSKQLTTSHFTESVKDENTKKMFPATASDSVTINDISTTSRSSYSTSYMTKEPKVTWSTFRYETKIKLRPSRKQARRMSTEFQKLMSRRKNHFARRREQQDGRKVAITQPDVTSYNNLMLKNAAPSHEGDTEIIEVEYV